MMGLRELRHFEAVYRLGAFRLAAEEQALTQPAITKSVQKLEHDLGLRLFDRTTRSVLPTAAAEQLIAPARALIRRAEDLEREASLLRGGTEGSVVLGASPLPTESLIAPALQPFLARHPAVRVEVMGGSQKRLVEQLLARSVDFVVLGGVAFEAIRFEEEIAIQHLPAEPAVIVLRSDHPLLRAGDPSERYLDYPWAHPRVSADDYARFPEPFRKEIERRGIPQLRLESVSACLQLVECSDVLTAVPRSVGRRARKRGGVEIVPYPFPLTTTYAVLTNRQRTMSPAAMALRENIQAVARAAAQRVPVSGKGAKKQTRRV